MAHTSAIPNFFLRRVPLLLEPTRIDMTLAKFPTPAAVWGREVTERPCGQRVNSTAVSPEIAAAAITPGVPQLLYVQLASQARFWRRRASC